MKGKDGVGIYKIHKVKKKLKRRRGQVTMTQMGALRRAKGVGVSIVGAEEFQKGDLRECFSLMQDIEDNESKTARLTRKGWKNIHTCRKRIDELDIPSPPSLSGDDDNDDDNRDEDFFQDDHLGRTSGSLFEEESIVSFSDTLKEWMISVKDDVKSAHIELLRARLLELLRSHRTNKAYSELRVMRSHTLEVGAKWTSRFNLLLHDIQVEMGKLYGIPLDIEPL